MAEEEERKKDSAYLAHTMRIARLPKCDTDSPECVERRINCYFDICIEDDMKPSMAELALSLGISRETLQNWRYGKSNKPKEVKDLIEGAYMVINAQLELYMQSGRINPVAGIFLSKNNLGYTDKTEIVLTPNDPLGSDTANSKKYLDAYETLGIDTEDDLK